MHVQASLHCTPRDLHELHQALLDRYARVANQHGPESPELARVKQLLGKVADAQVTCDRVAQQAA